MTTRARNAALIGHFGLDPADAKVLIVGAGATGFSVARFLRGQGVEFAIVDSRDKPPLLPQLLETMPDAPVFTGGFDEAAFKVATHLVVSPGVSLEESSIVKACAGGARIISDIDLLASCTAAPIVAITGSNGKSTVTTMLGEMAKAAGKRVAVGGNLGTPALALLDAAVELYVLELSSFQLERTSVLNAAAATALNVTADHLDRHRNMADYAHAKQRIFNGNGVCVLNADDPVVLQMAQAGRTVSTFAINDPGADFHLRRDRDSAYLMHLKQPLLALEDLPLEGLHNAANALAALALGVAVGLEKDAMCRALKRFKGLEHRMQKVAVRHGVNWINDSKATNIGACVAALQGYPDKVILIAGGDAKGADMSELAPVLKAQTQCVIVMGKDGPLIERAISGAVPVYAVASVAHAVTVADSLAQAGDTVLLSPACASLDQYKSYADRGEKFAAAVLALPA